MGNEEMFDPFAAEEADGGLDRELRLYVDLRHDHARKEADAKDAKRALDEQRDRLYDYLESQGAKTVNHDLGRFTRTLRTIAVVKDKEALGHWIDRAGLRGLLIKTDVRHAELNRLMKEALEEGAESPDGVEPLSVRQITFTEVK